MLFTMRPATDEFYDLFDRAAANLARGTEYLVGLLAPDASFELTMTELAGSKYDSDRITKKAHQAISNTYFTPFARAWVSRLLTDLRSTMSRLESVGYLLTLVSPSPPPALPAETGQLIGILHGQAEVTVTAVSRLRPNQDIVEFIAQWQANMADIWAAYDQLAEQARHAHRDLRTQLAHAEDQPLTAFRKHAVAQELKAATTAFDQVAATLATIVFKANG